MKARRTSGSKVRLDDLLVERGLAPDRDTAGRWVMAGQVRVAGQVASLASTVVAQDVVLTVDSGPPFVSRGGEKRAAAPAAPVGVDRQTHLAVPPSQPGRPALHCTPFFAALTRYRTCRSG